MLTPRAPCRGKSDTEDSARTTAEHQTHRHVVEDSQPEHEPDRDADQHAGNEPCADGRCSDCLVVRHTTSVPDGLPEVGHRPANPMAVRLRQPSNQPRKSG